MTLSRTCRSSVLGYLTWYAVCWRMCGCSVQGYLTWYVDVGGVGVLPTGLGQLSVGHVAGDATDPNRRPPLVRRHRLVQYNVQHQIALTETDAARLALQTLDRDNT